MPFHEYQLAFKGKQFLWRDYENATDAEIDALGAEFQFHPLTLDDSKTEGQRSKLVAYDNYLFASVHTVKRVEGELTPIEMEAFLSERYLITVHRAPLEYLDIARKHYEQSGPKEQLGPDFLFYLMADQMVDAYFPILEGMDEEIDTLEDEILEKVHTETLHRIFKIKQQLVQLRKLAAPMREVLNALASTRFGTVDARTAIYFRDVYDHLLRIYDFSETSRDLLSNALDMYLSVVSNRLNEVVKRLTIVSTIFLPISFVVGLGGMNFQQFPFANDVMYWVVIASLVAVPAGMLLYFKREGWF